MPDMVLAPEPGPTYNPPRSSRLFSLMGMQS